MPRSLRAGNGVRRVHVLMFDVGGSGGVARTVINLANRLSDQHEVRLISLYRSRDEPRFPVDPRVRLDYLEDVRATGPKGGPIRLRASQNPERKGLRVRLDQEPTRLRPEPSETQMSRLTDWLLWRRLRTLRSGVLITTRPSLHLAAARYAPRRLAVIGQDHLNLPARLANAKQAEVLRAAVPRLDGYVVLTHADAEDYRRELPGMSTQLAVIRNALPWSVSETPAPLESKVVVAAGRLSPVKGFQRLVEAWGPVARDHPDWQLHIYGKGPEHGALSSLIAERGLQDQAVLKGYTDDLKGVMWDSSVFAMSSHKEGFPMVLIEAMSTGLPLVAFDCPRGPAEIIDQDKNGRLVADGDLAGFTAALRDLVEDPELRRRLGARAFEDARQYETDRIVAQWESFIEQVARARHG